MAVRMPGNATLQPEISVLMPVRDGEAHLAEALDSLARQTFRDYELVVVDDGSRDETAAILAHRAASDPRIRIFRNDSTLGIPAALNRGLAYCNGTFIARADADDRNAPQRLARQLDFLRRHPKVGILGSSYRRINADGSLHSIKHQPLEDGTIRARQFFINSFLHPSVVFRAELVRSGGGYDERYWTAQDTELWARLRDRTRFANLPDLLVDYRMHDRSMMRTRGAEGQALSMSVPHQLLGELLSRPLERREVAAAVRLFQAYETVPRPDIALGIRVLREALDRIARTLPSAAAQRVRREAARACLKQLSRQRWRDGTASAGLVKAAFGLDPAIAFRGPARGVLLRKLTG